MLKRMTGLVILVMVASGCAAIRPHTVRLDIARSGAEYPTPTVEFSPRGNQEAAGLEVRLGEDKLVANGARRELYLVYRRIQPTDAQLKAMERLLARDGFPSETDMPFVRYVRRQKFTVMQAGDGRRTVETFVPGYVVRNEAEAP